MPQSLAMVLVHIIFSTKDRQGWLSQEVRGELYSYLATVAREARCECFRIGGVADHVHVAVGLGRSMAIADLVETLKTSSSKWIKGRGPEWSSFSWQRGYAVFSVGPKDLDALKMYIDRQEEHHRKQTYREEYVAFLRRYGVDFDERYFLD